jgi:hypothetical protein
MIGAPVGTPHCGSATPDCLKLLWRSYGAPIKERHVPPIALLGRWGAIKLWSFQDHLRVASNWEMANGSCWRHLRFLEYLTPTCEYLGWNPASLTFTNLTHLIHEFLKIERGP